MVADMQSSPGDPPWWQQPAQSTQPIAASARVAAGPAMTATAPAPPAQRSPAEPWWERSKSTPEASKAPSATASPGGAPAGPLDIRSLLHPTEGSRLAIALTATAVVFGFAGFVVIGAYGVTVLVIIVLFLAGVGGSIWLSLQIARSRLLGGAVQVSQASMPELQAIFAQVRARHDYHQQVDVYVTNKVDDGSIMTSYLGTRIILIEGGLVAELLEEEHYAELTFLIGRHLGQLKAKHQRLQWILIVISLVDSLKFLQLFLAPYSRATVKSGDQIAATCCDDIRATAWMMNRLLVGKELGPRLDIRGVLDQAVIVRNRTLPQLAQMFQDQPHTTNRYLNLLAFFARTAPHQIETWRATLDPATANRLTDVLNTANSRWW
jgi:hypothetical protein